MNVCKFALELKPRLFDALCVFDVPRVNWKWWHSGAHTLADTCTCLHLWCAQYAPEEERGEEGGGLWVAALRKLHASSNTPHRATQKTANRTQPCNLRVSMVGGENINEWRTCFISLKIYTRAVRSEQQRCLVKAKVAIYVRCVQTARDHVHCEKMCVNVTPKWRRERQSHIQFNDITEKCNIAVKLIRKVKSNKVWHFNKKLVQK